MKKAWEDAPAWQRCAAFVLCLFIVAGITVILVAPDKESRNEPLASAPDTVTTTSVPESSDESATETEEDEQSTPTTQAPPAAQSAQHVRPATDTTLPSTTEPPASTTTTPQSPATTVTPEAPPPTPPTTEPIGIERRYITVVTPAPLCGDPGCGATVGQQGIGRIEVNCYTGGGLYGIVGTDGILYISETFVVIDERGGLGLPSCSLY